MKPQHPLTMQQILWSKRQYAQNLLNALWLQWHTEYQQSWITPWFLHWQMVSFRTLLSTRNKCYGNPGPFLIRLLKINSTKHVQERWWSMTIQRSWWMKKVHCLDSLWRNTGYKLATLTTIEGKKEKLIHYTINSKTFACEILWSKILYLW